MIISLLAASQLHGILIGALIIFILILLIAGLMYCIERWISPIPGIVKLVLAIIILVCIVIWAFNIMGVSL